MSRRPQLPRRKPASAKQRQNSVASSSKTPALLPRRLAAIIYDALLLAAVLIVATGAAMLVVTLLAGSAAAQDGGLLTRNPWFQTYLLMVCFFFYASFWVHGGQTLGMRAWRLRVVRSADGALISWQQALLKFLSGAAWLLPSSAAHQLGLHAWGWQLLIASAALLIMLWLRLPERCSNTQLVVLPKPVK